jgi:hypothetical protein
MAVLAGDSLRGFGVRGAAGMDTACGYKRIVDEWDDDEGQKKSMAAEWGA